MTCPQREPYLGFNEDVDLGLVCPDTHELVEDCRCKTCRDVQAWAERTTKKKPHGTYNKKESQK